MKTAVTSFHLLSLRICKTRFSRKSVAVCRVKILNTGTILKILNTGTVLQVGNGIARINVLDEVMTYELVEFEEGAIEIALNLDQIR